MAGPFKLNPGSTQFGISTHAFLSTTKVIVDNESNTEGRISMTAGGSPSEFDDVPPGEITFTREFGGVELAVKNEGKVPLTVRTE